MIIDESEEEDVTKCFASKSQRIEQNEALFVLLLFLCADSFSFIHLIFIFFFFFRVLECEMMF